MARRTKKAGGAREGMQIATLFKNGRNQAVRLPKEFRFEGDAVYVKPVAGGIVLLAKADPWASIVEAYELADPKHPIKRHKPPVQKRSFR
jgi:antitoxin VapB